MRTLSLYRIVPVALAALALAVVAISVLLATPAHASGPSEFW